jgi:hypothetical protein
VIRKPVMGPRSSSTPTSSPPRRRAARPRSGCRAARPALGLRRGAPVANDLCDFMLPLPARQRHALHEHGPDAQVASDRRGRPPARAPGPRRGRHRAVPGHPRGHRRGRPLPRDRGPDDRPRARDPRGLPRARAVRARPGATAEVALCRPSARRSSTASSRGPDQLVPRMVQGRWRSNGVDPPSHRGPDGDGVISRAAAGPDLRARHERAYARGERWRVSRGPGGPRRGR